MPFSPTSPVTGATQPDLTNPTYTLSSDTAPTITGKQYAVTSLGGTQSGVTTHTVSSPFTINFVRPAVLKSFPILSSVGSLLKSVPNNVWKIVTRKGVTPAAGQPASPLIIRTEISVPAGAETYDSHNMEAALSAHFGACMQQASGIATSLKTGLSS